MSRSRFTLVWLIPVEQPDCGCACACILFPICVCEHVIMSVLRDAAWRTGWRHRRQKPCQWNKTPHENINLPNSYTFICVFNLKLNIRSAYGFRFASVDWESYLPNCLCIWLRCTVSRQPWWFWHSLKSATFPSPLHDSICPVSACVWEISNCLRMFVTQHVCCHVTYHKPNVCELWPRPQVTSSTSF